MIFLQLSDKLKNRITKPVSSKRAFEKKVSMSTAVDPNNLFMPSSNKGYSAIIKFNNSPDNKISCTNYDSSIIKSTAWSRNLNHHSSMNDQSNFRRNSKYSLFLNPEIS